MHPLLEKLQKVKVASKILDYEIQQESEHKFWLYIEGDQVEPFFTSREEALEVVILWTNIYAPMLESTEYIADTLSDKMIGIMEDLVASLKEYDKVLDSITKIEEGLL